MEPFERALDFVLAWEGGYTNDPLDPGGATNLGITQREYDQWRWNRKRPARSVREIALDEARAIYRDQYWTPCRCGELHWPLSCPVFLAAVLGLRRGEIAGIRWDDLDRQRGELRIRRQRRASKGRGIIEKGLKTASSARTLRLTPALIAEIDGRGDLDHPYICTKNERPWRPDELTREWTQARESFGLPTWTFHDLRHGAAGLLYAAGADLLEFHRPRSTCFDHRPIQRRATAPIPQKSVY